MIEAAGVASAEGPPTRLEVLSAAIRRVIPDGLRPLPCHPGELTFEVESSRLLDVATTLRDHAELKFQMCMDVCGVDYLEHGRSEWKTEAATSSGFSRGVARRNRALSEIAAPAPDAAPPPPRFAVLYHLLSIAHNQRVRLKVFCPDEAQPMVDSVTGIWASANWFERETFDLFGILFRGHPDLRRLLTDYGFIGHPFRKDFPLSGNVEVRYDPEKGRVVYQPVSIEPRVLVPKVIRHDNRYDPALTNAKPDGTPNV
jgi:NADH-quinone oxidoreductase subunit C